MRSKTSLERLETLTLAAEAAALADDWEGVRALARSRAAELARCPAGAADPGLQALDARVVVAMEAKRDALSARIRGLGHGVRVARAYRAYQSKAGKRVDRLG